MSAYGVQRGLLYLPIYIWDHTYVGKKHHLQISKISEKSEKEVFYSENISSLDKFTLLSLSIASTF